MSLSSQNAQDCSPLQRASKCLADAVQLVKSAADTHEQVEKHPLFFAAQWSGGGAWALRSKNAELARALQDKAPEFLRRHPELWYSLRDMDHLLCDLIAAMPGTYKGRAGEAHAVWNGFPERGAWSALPRHRDCPDSHFDHRQSTLLNGAYWLGHLVNDPVAYESTKPLLEAVFGWHATNEGWRTAQTTDLIGLSAVAITTMVMRRLGYALTPRGVYEMVAEQCRSLMDHENHDSTSRYMIDVVSGYGEAEYTTLILPTVNACSDYLQAMSAVQSEA